MGTVCLSPAIALRCVGLSRTEEIITLIPAALEVIFSLGLVFADCDAGRARYILAAEGPTYFLLAVLSLLDRVIPLFEYSLKAHKILDIAIGAASFIPILLYLFYLYLFKRREFFPHLPRRFTLVATAFAWAVIPFIIVTDEIGSFLGIQYRMVPDPESRIVGNQIAVGPDLTSFQFGREFLRSTSLALLIIYQLITFLLFFMRLTSCIVAQRDIEDRAAAEREGILFGGIGWLVIGMKISAIESATGFATMSFGLILTRRILRMLGRACIIIGIVKGVDRREEFLILDSDNLKGNEFLSGTRKLKMPGKRFTISGPRLVQSSMAQRMSRMTSLRPSLATFATPRSSSPSPSDMDRMPFVSRPASDSELRADWPTPPFALASKYRPSSLQLERISSESHVSVVHGHNRAPTLVLNLSPMELPSSDIFAAMSSRRSENQTSTSTVVDIDYVSVPPMPLSAPALRSSPPPQFVAVAPPGISSGSSEGKGARGRKRSGMRWSQPRSLPPAVPPIPFSVSPASVPASPGSFLWPSTESERSESVVESLPPSGGVIQVPTRSRADESQSTLGGILIDWIAPEGGGDGRVAPGMTRIKSVGAVPRRTTPNPTSAGAVRNSVVLERHESLAVAGARTRPQSRREMPRKDSGVLGMDDPALRRASPRPH